MHLINWPRYSCLLSYRSVYIINNTGFSMAFLALFFKYNVVFVEEKGGEEGSICFRG